MEDRRVAEVTIGMRSELVTTAVNVKLFPLNLAFGMYQQHDADCEGSETELVGREDLASPTDRLTAMAHAEL